LFSGIALCLAAYSLRPVLYSGYYFDDSLNSLLRAHLSGEGKSLWNHLYETATSFPQGRFGPLSAGSRFLVHYIFHEVEYYKVAILTGIVANIAFFGYFLRRFTGSFNLAMASMLLIPIFFQIRNYHDPITSYNLLLQQMCFLLFASLIFFHAFLAKKKLSTFLASAICYLSALLTYEIGFSFLIFFFILAWHHHKNLIASLKTTAPLVFLTIAVLAVNMYARMQFPAHYSGVKANLKVEALFTAFFEQLCGALPLSYYSQVKGPVLAFLAASDVGYALILFSLCLYFLKKTGDEKIEPTCLIISGFALWVLPACVIALSEKYQNELTFGTAYLPVYLQYFGLLMLLMGVFSAVYAHINSFRVKNLIAVLVSFMAAAIGLITMAHNKAIVEEMNLSWKYPREVLGLALKKGLAAEIPTDSIIWVSAQGPHPAWYLFANKDFFYQYSGKTFTVLHERDGVILRGNVVNEKNVLGRSELNALSGRIEYVMSYSSTRRDAGIVLLSRVKNSLLSPNASGHEHGPGDVEVTVDKVFTVNGTKQRMLNYSGNNAPPGTSLEKGTAGVAHYLFIEGSGYDAAHGIVGYASRKGVSGEHTRCIVFGPVTLPDRFHVEIVLRPLQDQVPYANIMGNRGSDSSYEGFAIEQDGENQNTFSLVVGDGREWLPSATFRVDPQAWNYLAFSINRHVVKSYVNGKLTGSVRLKGPLRNSAMQVYVGNRANFDRPFHGQIGEVIIGEGDLPTKDTSMKWLQMNDNLRSSR